MVVVVVGARVVGAAVDVVTGARLVVVVAVATSSWSPSSPQVITKRAADRITISVTSMTMSERRFTPRW